MVRHRLRSTRRRHLPRVDIRYVFLEVDDTDK